jgi:hypothetical protein
MLQFLARLQALIPLLLIHFLRPGNPCFHPSFAIYIWSRRIPFVFFGPAQALESEVLPIVSGLGGGTLDPGSGAVSPTDVGCNNPISVVNLMKITLSYPLLSCY